MYDYVDGKSDWMAYGLAVEGEDGPFAGSMVRDAVTCQWDQTGASVRSAVAASHAHDDHHGHDHGDHREHDHGEDDHREDDHGEHDHGEHDHGEHDHGEHDHGEHRRGRHQTALSAVVVLGPGGLAIGSVDREALESAADDALVLDIMDPVPTTVRPSTTLASLKETGDGRALVSTSDGRLLGQVSLSDEDEDEDEEDETEDYGEYGAEIADILAEVEQRFGSREPTEEQLRSFLHERLVAEGRTKAEADQFLDEMGDSEPE